MQILTFNANKTALRLIREVLLKKQPLIFTIAFLTYLLNSNSHLDQLGSFRGGLNSTCQKQNILISKMLILSVLPA